MQSRQSAHSDLQSASEPAVSTSALRREGLRDVHICTMCGKRQGRGWQATTTVRPPQEPTGMAGAAAASPSLSIHILPATGTCCSQSSPSKTARHAAAQEEPAVLDLTGLPCPPRVLGGLRPQPHGEEPGLRRAVWHGPLWGMCALSGPLWQLCEVILS